MLQLVTTSWLPFTIVTIYGTEVTVVLIYGNSELPELQFTVTVSSSEL